MCDNNCGCTRIINTGGGGGGGGLLETAPGHLGPATGTETDVSGLRDTGQTTPRVEVDGDIVEVTPNGTDLRVRSSDVGTWINHPANPGINSEVAVGESLAFGGPFPGIALSNLDPGGGVSQYLLLTSDGVSGQAYSAVSDGNGGAYSAQAVGPTEAISQGAAEYDGAHSGYLAISTQGDPESAQFQINVFSPSSTQFVSLKQPDALFEVLLDNPVVGGHASFDIYAGDNASGPFYGTYVHDVLGGTHTATASDQDIFVERESTFTTPSGATIIGRHLARTKLTPSVNVGASSLEVKRDDGVVMFSIPLALNVATGNYEIVP
jgi:hypothetical protein